MYIQKDGHDAWYIYFQHLHQKNKLNEGKKKKKDVHNEYAFKEGTYPNQAGNQKFNPYIKYFSCEEKTNKISFDKLLSSTKELASPPPHAFKKQKQNI